MSFTFLLRCITPITKLSIKSKGILVAALFGLSPSTICKLKTKFCTMGDISDRPQSGCPKKTAPQEDLFYILSALRNCREPSTDLHSMISGGYTRQLSTERIQKVFSLTEAQDQTADQREVEMPGCCDSLCGSC